MRNYSRQREIILEVIKNTKTHPTAEEICKLVKEIEPKISRSTLYRNLKLLVEGNVIKKLTMPYGSDRFDYIHNPHNHIVCERCKKTVDFEYDFYEKDLARKIKEETGIETNLDCITINGICEDCKLKNKI
ncbi:MAG: transcriptional repressor [Clostridia bacterium]